MAYLKKVGSKYHIRYRDPVTNKVRSKATSCKHLANAKQKMAEFEKQLEQGIEPELGKKPQTIATMLDDYERVLIARGNSADYIANTRFRLEVIVEGLTNLARINEDWVVLRMAKHGVKDGSKKYYRSAIKSFCKWTFMSDRLAADPLARMKTACKVRESDDPRRILSEEEFQRLIDTAPYDNAVVYSLAALSGLRAKEIRTLEADHIDLSQPALYAKASLSKAGKRDWLPLPAGLAEVLGQCRMVLAQSVSGQSGLAQI